MTDYSKEIINSTNPNDIDNFDYLNILFEDIRV